jgi:glutamine cyclotransferase
MRFFCAILLGLSLLASVFSCNLARRDNVKAQSSELAQQDMQLTVPGRIVNYTYEVVNTYPHDSAAFTQGLVFYQGVLYESTGLNGASSLRKVELETGRVLKKLDIPGSVFCRRSGLVQRTTVAIDLAKSTRLCLRPGELSAIEYVPIYTG